MYIFNKIVQNCMFLVPQARILGHNNKNQNNTNNYKDKTCKQAVPKEFFEQQAEACAARHCFYDI